jgi:hypothetical protein
MFPNIYFQGSGAVTANSSLNSTVPLGASFKVLGNTWASLASPLSTSNTSFIIWDSVMDTSVLPIPSNLVITNIQSAGCVPPCAGAGSCNPSTPVCVCPPGFNGTLCQSCSEGHFGPTCRPCPSSCTNCDQGITGSGKCINAAAQCNCLHGECGDNGKCKCLPGWGQSQNGTACAQCDQGFFILSNDFCSLSTWML